MLKNSELSESLSQIKETMDEDEFEEFITELDELESSNEQIFSLLNVKIKDVTPEQLNDLRVNDNIYFKDPVWPLDMPQGRVFLKFKCSLPRGVLNYEQANDSLTKYYKILTFFQFPNNDFDGSKRSYATTYRHYWRFKYLIDFLLIKNGLYFPEVDIQKVTIEQVYQALNSAKETGKHGVYEELYNSLMSYFRLMELDLLPPHYHFSFTRYDIDCEKILKDVLAFKIQKQSTYYPLDESELEALNKVIFDYSSTYGCEFNTVYKLLHDAGLAAGNRQFIDLPNPIAEKLMNFQFSNDANGTSWCSFTLDKKKARLDLNGFNSSVRKRILAACIIVVALLTGMRIREIAALKHDCCRKINDEEFELTFTRFKTSSDPNNGQIETMPVPKSVYESIECIKNIFQMGRKEKKSDYLFATSKHTYDPSSHKKSRAFIQSISLGAMVREFGRELGIQKLHIHRLRKTIAWLLISKSEKNIELVRHLLGHHSYEMTLRYVLRNHELVEEVVHLFENHYTNELTDLMQSIFNNSYSGDAADSIKKQLDEKPDAFQAEIINTTIEEYIKGLFEVGEQIFLNRVPIGGHCVVTNIKDFKNKTPCMRLLEDGSLAPPDPQLCEWQKCNRKILTEHAIPNLERDLTFYKQQLKRQKLTVTVEKEYRRSIEIYNTELKRLKGKPDPTPQIKRFSQ